MLRPLFVAALVAGLLSSTAARADAVTITGFQWGSSDIDTSLSGTVAVGQFKGTHNGNAFVTYCTDLYESFNWNTPYINYLPVANGSTYGFTAAKADTLGKLYTVASAQVDTADESVAFQLAVWEVLYDNAFQVRDVSGRGHFYVQSGGAMGQQTLANGWLAQASALGSSQFSVMRLASVDAPGLNDGRQDFILVNRVPEPQTHALMLAGLGAMAFVTRRRRTGD